MLTPKSSKARFDAECRRFDRMMDTQGDLLTVLLKGHLLIEEMLSDIIRVGVAQYHPLEDARFTFAQQLRLAKAVAGEFISDDIFDAIRRTNSVRNTLAHEIEPTSLGEKVEDFLNWCSTQPRLAKFARSESHAAQLLAILGFIWAFLAGTRESLRIVKQHLPRPMDGARHIKTTPPSTSSDKQS